MEDGTFSENANGTRSDWKIARTYLSNALVISLAFVFIIFVVSVIILKVYHFSLIWTYTLAALGYLIGIWLGIGYSARSINQQYNITDPHKIIQKATVIFGTIVVINALVLLNKTSVFQVLIWSFSIVTIAMFYVLSSHYLKGSLHSSEEIKGLADKSEKRKIILLRVGYIAIAIGIALVVLQQHL